VLCVVYAIWRLRGRKSRSGLQPKWGLLFGFAYLAGLSHILLDYTNAYGVRPFWPFSERWYSWDIVSIVEPVLLLFLIGGLALPGLSALIDKEMNVRRKVPRGRLAASLALLGMALVWMVRDYEHRHAIASLEARTYEGAQPLRASAYPYMLDPFHWSGVVETNDFFATTLVNSSSSEVDPGGDMKIRQKPEETPVTLAAKRTYLGRVYLDWAAYPITETEQQESGTVAYVVRFKDLRYLYPDEPGDARRTVLSAFVTLDKKLKTVAEGMGVRRAPE
nr:metal-dependent hydrolase [Terriglobales bacterium]